MVTVLMAADPGAKVFTLSFRTAPTLKHHILYGGLISRLLINQFLRLLVNFTFISRLYG